MIRRRRRSPSLAAIAAVAVVAAGVAAVAGGAFSACHTADPAHAVPDGDPERGELAIRRYGCGTCHEIPGIRGANGHVGPSLAELAGRRYLAGQLPNTPAYLIQWIRQPQSVVPGNVMPDMAVTPHDAADIAAALYHAR
jgi:cytochrome c